MATTAEQEVVSVLTSRSAPKKLTSRPTGISLKHTCRGSKTLGVAQTKSVYAKLSPTACLLSNCPVGTGLGAHPTAQLNKNMATTAKQEIVSVLTSRSVPKKRTCRPTGIRLKHTCRSSQTLLVAQTKSVYAKLSPTACLLSSGHWIRGSSY